MRRCLIRVFSALLCIFTLSMGGRAVVFADAEPTEDSFSGKVEMMKKDGSNFVMQVTVGNAGEDFSGTVQLIFTGSGNNNCAYNTEITLPAQGRKQYTITVPERAVETVRGSCVLRFLDEKGNLLQSIQRDNVFGNAVSGYSVGILSDNYSGLTYMDTGGMDYTIRGKSAPFNLIELDKDNLKGYLDGLYFLVIDQFNVSALSGENIQAIQDWVKDGGWLLIGTGPYAEWTLSGFDEDFHEANILNITEPGEENAVSVRAERGDYYNYVDAGIDFTQMRIAELDYSSKIGVYYESSLNPAICNSMGDGSVMILTFSLGEEELRKLDDYMIQEIYDELIVGSNSYNTRYGNSNMEYVGERALAYIDSSNTDIDFTWLELLIGVYVILVGPVLYLILRKCKKREWYWIGVPVAGLAFVVCVFLFGQEIQVNETKVYSVTVQQADSDQMETYFLAYHSGVKPWSMCLNDTYEVAGPGWKGYYTYNTDNYHYVVSYDREGMWVGLNPRENFESGFLYAGGRTDKKGTISGTNVKGFDIGGSVSGTITNGTNCDMSYMALWDGSYIMVFSDVKAGETLDLQQAVSDGRCVFQDSVSYYENLLHRMVSVYGYNSNLDYRQDDMAALLLGLGIADEARRNGRNYAVVAGVVRDYEKAVVSKCNEISYGCLYSYIETEAGENASD